MAYTFTEAQLTDINNTVSQIGENDNWKVAYDAVVAALIDAVKDDEPEGVAEADRAYVDAVHVWFKGAVMVNTREGAFSRLIRSYTKRQLGFY